jgi:DNA mismatch repair protein MutS
MIFRSILNPSDSDANAEIVEAPACFPDLNLDQIVSAITTGKQEYNLPPFFYKPLRSREAIEYRQDVMRDLEDKAHFETVASFANAIRSVREHLAQVAKLHYKYQKEAWFLDAVDLYCCAVRDLQSQFSTSTATSDGLVSFIDFLITYVDSEGFRQLIVEIATLKARLASIRYTLLISNGVITVSTYDDEPDYGAEIQADFEKFKQGAAKDHIFNFNDFVQMNHIEADVVDRVARLYPDIFADLDAFAARNHSFFDPTIRRFDREIQFYIAYIAHMQRVAAAGVTFCYPRVSVETKEIGVTGGCDLALAKILSDKRLKIVPNDFFLSERERIFIVSGPNQGGKTTFARMFGQLHYLGSLGYPVPGIDAQLFLFDQLFTHFEKEEDIHNLRGKLHDDLFRLHNTLSEATSNSIIILNEVFNSTSLKDAIFLSTKVLSKIVELDALCVCVTFIDELAGLSETMVSMASTVKPDNLAERTFKVVRRPPDGLAYAISIAQKYRLTYSQLRERLTA